MIFPNFDTAIDQLRRRLIDQSQMIDSGHWQGVATEGHPEMLTHELVNTYFRVPLAGREDLDHWAKDTHATKAWADMHFQERVSMNPNNPGHAYLEWPWWNNQVDHTQDDGKFSHTYQERFWPRWAGNDMGNPAFPEHQGIRYRYGDTVDLIELLKNHPTTRQAYLPIFFPEDTGAHHGGRIPCTLGYYFLMRDGYLHIHYPIRSCDFIRHFRNDCYMAIRLLLWVLSELRLRDLGRWENVRPGFYSMWIGSLHVFINDMIMLKRTKL